MARKSLFISFLMFFLVSCIVKNKVFSREITKDDVLRARQAVECDTNRLELVRVLIKEGFPVNHKVDDDGLTFLHHAIILGDDHLIRFLISQGASLAIEGICHIRPVDLVENGNTNIIWKIIESAAPKTEDTIDDIPRYFLEPFTQLDKADRRTYLLYINGRPASSGILKWLSSFGVSFYANDYVESVSQRFMKKGPPVKEQPIFTYEIFCDRISSEKFVFEYRLTESGKSRDDGAPYFLLISYRKGEYTKRHGFWFYKSVEAID